MIDQRNRPISFGEALRDFFKGFVDFKGYSSRAGFWFPVATVVVTYVLVFLLTLGGAIFSLISSTSSGRYYSHRGLESLLSHSIGTFLLLGILIIIAVVLYIPFLAVSARRLRDVGFSNWGITIVLVLYFIFNYINGGILSLAVFIGFIVLVSLAPQTLETDKNDDFSKFFFRQTVAAREHYAQFNNQFNNFQNNGQFNNQNQNVQNNAPVQEQSNVVATQETEVATEQVEAVEEVQNNNEVEVNQEPKNSEVAKVAQTEQEVVNKETTEETTSNDKETSK